jgi:hypothetical protein
MAKGQDPFTYLAKYVSKQGGDLHLGGTLEGVNFSEFLKSRQPYGRKTTAISANLPRGFFHVSDPRIRRKR